MNLADDAETLVTAVNHRGLAWVEISLTGIHLPAQLRNPQYLGNLLKDPFEVKEIDQLRPLCPAVRFTTATKENAEMKRLVGKLFIGPLSRAGARSAGDSLVTIDNM